MSTHDVKVVQRRAILIFLVGLVAFFGGTGIGRMALAGESNASSSEGMPVAGLGDANIGLSESLIVVVAGNYDDGSTAAAAENEIGLGDVQGFYLDIGKNYQVLGAYLSDAPTLEDVRCGSKRAEALQLFCSTEGSDLHDGDVATLHLPTQLRYFPAQLSSVEAIRGRSETCSGSRYEIPCPHPLVVDVSGSWQLDPDATYRLTAFRTRAGAEAFVDLVRDVGNINVSILRVKKLAGPYIGLGQEGAPDGSGPLLGPLPGQASYQG